MTSATSASARTGPQVRPSQSITKHHKASQSITKHHKASQSIAKHHKASQSITKHHKALPLFGTIDAIIRLNHAGKPKVTKYKCGKCREHFMAREKCVFFA
jgi:hypothetical protein